VGSVNAQQKNANFITSNKWLTVQQGLSSPEVFCGLQDSLGFIWFGTRNGLNRYDGKNFQHYNTQSGTLRSNIVAQIATDNGRKLYIQYGVQGHSRLPFGDIDVMDIITGEVKPLAKVFPKLPFEEKKIYWIANDGTKDIFFLTFEPFQLWKYNDQHGFKLVLTMKDWIDKTQRFSDLTGPFNYFNKGEAVLGMRKSSIYHISSKGIKRHLLTDLGATTLTTINKQNQIGFHYTNPSVSDGKFGTILQNGNVVYTQPPSITFKKIVKEPSVTNNDTTCLFNIPDSGIYFHNGRLTEKIVDAYQFEDFANLQIHANFRDRENLLWICTSLGVFQVKIVANKFTHYFSKSQQKLVTNNQARGIFVDDDGTIYGNIWDHIFRQKDDKVLAANAGEILYGLEKYDDKIFSSGYYLQQFNARQNLFLKIRSAHTGREILSVLPYNDTLILLGCVEQVYRFNPKANRLTMVKDKKGNNEYMPNFVYRFIRNEDGTVWAVAESGLYLIPVTGTFTQIYSYGSTDKFRFPFKNLMDVYIDKKGIYWLATNGDGLYRWDKQLNQFKQYSIAQGLPSNVLYRIESDAKNNLWISSDNGLIHFNPSNANIYVFTTKDGLSHNEFNRMSSYRAKDGRLFFGGMNGINAFHPSDFVGYSTEKDIPVRLISFQQFSGVEDKLLDKTKQVLQQGKIVLEPDDIFFTIEYRLLDFEDNIHRYAYKIEGQDKTWNYTTENSIRVSGLPSGKYKLIIRAQTIAGGFSNIELVYPIEVIAPFYMRPWFQILILLCLLGAITLFVKIRTATLVRDKMQLEIKVANRTAQLQKTLSERELLLKEIHHRVKNNLQIISGLLDLQKEEIVHEDSKAVFSEGQSRVKSIALIHQNLYQNEDLANIKFSDFVQDLAIQVAEVFEHYDRKMKTSFDLDDYMFDIDTAVPLALILNELLTNSYKYASKAESVGNIFIKVNQSGIGNYLLIYKDDGPGLKDAVSFDTAGTLGLRLIKGLAEQLYGEATYQYNNGSVFTISFKDTAARKLE